jgi:hypothetical protein
MDEEVIKNIIPNKELDLAHILEQFETFERVYPYYQNMLQDHPSLELKEESTLNSTMKKQE